MAPREVTDGRAARSARTRAAVVDALLALIEAGDLRPTARRVAERAGISLRSVYVHFDDLEDLFLRAAARQIVKVAAAAGEPRTDGTFEERLVDYVRYRTTVLETSGPVRRAAALQEPFSPTLAALAVYSREAGRAELRVVFGPELERLAPATRAARLAAVDALVSPAGYDVLRLADDVDEATARDTLVDALRVLLTTTA